ncbi:MAG TPA: DUF1835 domain-containing protein [Sphingobacteriaceae bacterium]
MEQVLNVLNGDATLEKFRQTDLPGDILVWREILSEGPVQAAGISGFFRLRSDYLQTLAGAAPEDYQQKVVSEYDRLADYRRYSAVNLWFEFDLTDQVNLIFLLNFFHKKPGNSSLYLICPEEVPGYPDFRGIGELAPTDLQKLLPGRVQLTPEDLRIASAAWEAYCSGREEDIHKIIDGDTGRLQLLKPAFRAHLERFPDASGLDRIDRELLGILGTGWKDAREIYRIFSGANKIYGMSDLSVFDRLHQLEKRGLIPAGTVVPA